MGARAEHHRIVIVGSGFAGLGAAIRLLQEGERDFVVLERAAEVGGVWRDNTYPGCACDVQSHLYSFSFAPNPSWSRAYSPAAEIQAYLRDCAARFGVTPHLRFEREVRGADWDEANSRWRIETSQETFTAGVLIAATGALSDPAYPEIQGLDRFEGPAFHSARWRHDVALSGKRVAVIGTGASAIQIVPAIQPEVDRLLLFQRTPPWVVPRADHAIPPWAQALFGVMPGAQALTRGALYYAREASLAGFRDRRVGRLFEHLARRYLARVVDDPVLRAKLTPRYRIGCKRILVSDDYLPAVTRPNVELVTEGIREVRPRSIVTADGTEHEVDVIVFGTGFRVTDQPLAKWTRGRGGQTLEDAWAGSPKAFLGTTVAGFPNFFLLQGPNTGLGHTSVIVMIEAQVEHVLHALRHLEASGARALEPRPDAQDAFVHQIDADMAGTVWISGGCASWYLDATGRNSTLWPGSTLAFRRRLARFDPCDFTFTHAER